LLRQTLFGILGIRGAAHHIIIREEEKIAREIFLSAP
jgi:hypothetical protein